MVAVVNGYVCFTTCDADKAKQGKDPLAKPGEQSDDSKKKNGLDSQRATILDGALKNLKDAIDPSNPTSGVSPPGDTTSSSRVDVLA
jgi:hypothetical protein